MEKYIQLIKDKFGELTPEQKRHLVLFCTAGFAVLLTLSVILSLRGAGKDTIPVEYERVPIIIAIPAEELFLPDEPDFLPGVLLERDRRLIWTEQDANEHWQDPLRFGEEQWREKIETAIDDFLERVP